jgi:hypothetical protein
MDGEVDQQKWNLILQVVWKTINTCKECKETSAETSREPEKKTHARIIIHVVFKICYFLNVFSINIIFLKCFFSSKIKKYSTSTLPFPFLNQAKRRGVQTDTQEKFERWS